MKWLNETFPTRVLAAFAGAASFILSTRCQRGSPTEIIVNAGGFHSDRYCQNDDDQHQHSRGKHFYKHGSSFCPRIAQRGWRIIASAERELAALARRCHTNLQTLAPYSGEKEFLYELCLNHASIITTRAVLRLRRLPAGSWRARHPLDVGNDPGRRSGPSGMGP